MSSDSDSSNATPRLTVSRLSSPTGSLASLDDLNIPTLLEGNRPLAKQNLQSPKTPKEECRAQLTSPRRPLSGQILEHITSRYHPYSRTTNEHQAQQSPLSTMSLLERSEIFAREVGNMSTKVLKKAVLAKEASREYQRQNLATAWKIEELKRHLNLVESFREENEHRLTTAVKDLELFESFLSDDTPHEIRTESQRLLDTYHEDISVLSVTDHDLDCLMLCIPGEA